MLGVVVVVVVVVVVMVSLVEEGSLGDKRYFDIIKSYMKVVMTSLK